MLLKFFLKKMLAKVNTANQDSNRQFRKHIQVIVEARNFFYKKIHYVRNYIFVSQEKDGKGSERGSLQLVSFLNFTFLSSVCIMAGYCTFISKHFGVIKESSRRSPPLRHVRKRVKWAEPKLATYIGAPPGI
jgi:Ni,Fe-hydrogenase I cytochrome b subunit